ncbi:MAG TPA: ArsR family transcriptional regulator [Acidimicrobiia bacterium]
MKSASGLPLFRSPEQERLLAELFVFAREPLSLSELARRTGTSMGGVHKEVERLERSGLLVSKTSGRSRLVEPDRSSPLYTDLRGLLTKSMGPGSLLRDALSAIDGIQEAFIFGSWADPDQMAPQDIDLMVIGDPDLGEVYAAVSGVEAEVGRPINVVLRSRDEWADADEAFERAVRSRPRIQLI